MTLLTRRSSSVPVAGRSSTGVRWFGWLPQLARRTPLLRGRRRRLSVPSEDEHGLHGGGVEAAWPLAAEAAQQAAR